MLLSIIIVNFNVKFFLEQCLCSVLKAVKYIDGEIIVIDNNSTDESKSYFAGKFTNIKFVWNKSNDGFAKANNLGLKLATGEYILFLNPDTIVPEDCFEKCISFIRQKENSIAVGVKMIDGSGKFLKESKRAFPSPVTSLFKLAGLSNLFPRSRIFSRYHLGHLDENQVHEVDVLAGAFMMVPKEIINNTGGFDERFFMYAEDIDLSYRIQKAGYKNFYFSESCIIHFKGESTKKGGLNYVKMFYSAMSVFAKKHYGSSRAGFYNSLIQVAIFFRAGLSAFSRFTKWIGLAAIDAIIILMSFWIAKLFWNSFIKSEVIYSSNLLMIAFPAFTGIFLIASYFAGLYDNGFKQSRLTSSTIIAIVVLLAVYSFLPEDLRFSRGILLFGSLLAFILMSFTRSLFVRWQMIESTQNKNGMKETVIAGTEAQFDEVQALLSNAGMRERMIGRIGLTQNKLETTMGNISELNSMLSHFPIEEIIFCEGILSYKKIIESISKIPGKARFMIYSPCAQTLIGSEGRNVSGNCLAGNEMFNIEMPVHRRNKRLVDISLALFFLLIFPVHFFTKKNPSRFFWKIFAVLEGNYTWIGYCLDEPLLPALKIGILTNTGLPNALNTLPEKNLTDADFTYAKEYRSLMDLRIAWTNYNLL